VVNEVMSDLDLQRLTWGVPEGATVAPFDGVPVMANSTAEPEVRQEITNAAEAAAYMQQVALKLRSWRESMDKEKAPGTTSPVKN